MRRKNSLKEGPIHRDSRMHSSRLPSGHWLGKIVRLGKEKVMSKDSLTAAVTRVPGAYDSEEKALQTAKRYIDEAAVHRQDEVKGTGTPRPWRPPNVRAFWA